MLGSLLGSPGVGPGPGATHLRLISQGQEISQELDERTLAELGFKVAYITKLKMEGNLCLISLQDLQLVFASLGTGPARGGLSKFLPFISPSPPTLLVTSDCTCSNTVWSLLTNVQQGRLGLWLCPNKLCDCLTFRKFHELRELNCVA